MKANHISVHFPEEVEIPDMMDAVIAAMLSDICWAYQKANPTRVMWYCGGGLIDGCLSYEVAEREDLYGRNPDNPRRDELREEARKQKVSRENK